MSTFAGTLFDGHFAAREPVTVEVDGPRVTLVTESSRASLSRDDVRVDPPVPGVPRRLMLPGGASIESGDHAAIDAIWPAPSRIERAAYWLESHRSMSVAAVIVTALLVAAIIVEVLPLAADPIARAISPQIEQAIGRRALESIDAAYAKPSALPPERRDAIKKEFATLVSGDDDDVDLQFRSMGMPNAFALPGRTIIVTDEMVEFAKSDDELMAVLAHELGHLNNHHAMRMVLQQSGVAVLVAALAGDAVGMTILAVFIPATLLNARYSRAFELEADDYALDLLARHDRSRQAFADVLRRFAADKRTADTNDPVLRYLSSHPATDERVQRAEQAR